MSAKISRSEIIAAINSAATTRPSNQQKDNLVLEIVPLDIAQQMCAMFDHTYVKKYIVLMDLKIVEVFIYELDIDPKNIIFISDFSYKFEIAKLMNVNMYSWNHSKSIYLNFEEIKKISAQTFYGLDKMPRSNNLCIIGNPPYQAPNNGYGKAADSIYHKFVLESIKINPKYLSMIIPSRWMIGGKGLEEFRSDMQTDKRISKIVDYPNPSGIFENVDIAGGVCYFLRDREYAGLCEFNGTQRNLNAYDTIIRDSNAQVLVDKVVLRHKIAGKFLSDYCSSVNPYGVVGNYEPLASGVPCFFKKKVGLEFADRSDIKDARKDINLFKVIVPKSPIAGQTDLTWDKQIKIFRDDNVFVLEPGVICSATYLVLSSFKTLNEATNFKSYILSKFARALLKSRITSQDICKDKYSFVPHMKDYNVSYSEEKLYKMFHLDEADIETINRAIK